ncbi:MAG: hypothetical protein IJ400_04665 [Clostridia bacterium]|nr:hypothetical protein [Clostridia bacterium]
MKKLLLSILLFSLFPTVISCSSTSSQDYTITGTVTEVNANRLIIKSNEIDYQINFDKANTKITKNKSPTSPDQIKIGSTITVTHNGQMTRSLPPQVFALSITIEH